MTDVPPKGPPPWAPAAASIYRELEDDILEGRLPPEAVISEPVLSHRFGVSRAPLREAIWRLERHGLLIRPPRQRARVVRISAERMEQIFALREAVEGMAARLAAPQVTTAELDALQAPGADFHALIAEASRNAFVIRALTEHRGLIELCRRQQRRDPVRTKRSAVEHRRILDALSDKDPDLAELTMRRHIASARTMLAGAYG